MSNGDSNHDMNMVMNSTFRHAFERIENSIKSEIRNIKHDIDRIESGVNELKVNWLKDHDRIIKVEQELAQQEKEIKAFQEREERFGRQQDQKIGNISEEVNKRIDLINNIIIDMQKVLSKLNISVGKIIGIAGGASFIMGIIIALALKVFEKIL